MLACCARGEFVHLSPNDYTGSSLQLVEAFKQVPIEGKNCLVLGSISPWIECLLLHFKGQVTTLDYMTPVCDYKINTLRMDEYKGTQYDVILSFSSLEHDGLGRYGDPIYPNGDIDSCIEAYDMLAQGGHFLCAIPIGDGFIQGNYHRIYHKKRVDQMFSLFTRVGSVNYETFDSQLKFQGSDWQNQPLFICKK